MERIAFALSFREYMGFITWKHKHARHIWIILNRITVRKISPWEGIAEYRTRKSLRNL